MNRQSSRQLRTHAWLYAISSIIRLALHPELLRAIVRDDLMPLIDLEYSARLILGKAGRGVSPEELKAFSEAMSSILINRYSDGLLAFRSDEQVEAIGKLFKFLADNNFQWARTGHLPAANAVFES